MKVTALVGSYRKGKTVDTLVSKILEGAKSKGADTERIFLMDKKIEFCRNCRKCTTSEIEGKRSKCIINDDTATILDRIDASDVVVLSSPVNFGTVTAVMKKFIERLAVYYKWKLGKVAAPKKRIKGGNKKGVVVVSSTVPAFLGRIFGARIISIMKDALKATGVKDIEVFYVGMVPSSAELSLSEKKMQKAYKIGTKISS